MGTRGAKPGERRGGRAKGTPNKATAERERIAAGISREVGPEIGEALRRLAAPSRRKPAKDEIRDKIIPIIEGTIAHIQQRLLLRNKKGKPILDANGKPQIDPKIPLRDYLEWLKFLHFIWLKFMPYEQPRFGVVGVGPASFGDMMGGAAKPAADAAKAAPDNLKFGDNNAAMRVYLRLIQGRKAVPLARR